MQQEMELYDGRMLLTQAKTYFGGGSGSIPI
jgi:hypothetical protein